MYHKKKHMTSGDVHEIASAQSHGIKEFTAKQHKDANEIDRMSKEVQKKLPKKQLEY